MLLLLYKDTPCSHKIAFLILWVDSFGWGVQESRIPAVNRRATGTTHSSGWTVPAPEWTSLYWYHMRWFSNIIIWTTKRQKHTLRTCGCWPFEVSISCHATWESVINRPRSTVLPVVPITHGWEMCAASYYDSNIYVHTVHVNISKTQQQLDKNRSIHLETCNLSGKKTHASLAPRWSVNSRDYIIRE